MKNALLRTTMAMLTIVIVTYALPGDSVLYAQVSDTEENKAIAPFGSWDAKVVWRDIHGKKQVYRGRVLVLWEDAILLGTLSDEGTLKNRKIHASNMIRITYRPNGTPRGPNAGVEVLSGALTGGINSAFGGNVPGGMLLGAIDGLINGLTQRAQSGGSGKRKVRIDRRSGNFTLHVLPDIAGWR